MAGMDTTRPPLSDLAERDVMVARVFGACERIWCVRSRSVPRSDRILMGPGPLNPYPEVAEAMIRPMLGHLDPEFVALLDETCERLRQVFRTTNPLTLPISGTGSAGMEACFVNVVKPGDAVVVGVNGVFGERMAEV